MSKTTIQFKEKQLTDIKEAISGYEVLSCHAEERGDKPGLKRINDRINQLKFKLIRLKGK